MKCKKNIGYILLLVANILLMVHVFMPHHQHNNRSYCSVISKDRMVDDVYHTTTNHTHTAAEICTLDLIMERDSFSMFLNAFENATFYIYLAATLSFHLKSSLPRIISLFLCSLNCIAIILPSFSLRGPPQ